MTTEPLHPSVPKPATRSLEVLAQLFREFAETECGTEPVYDALCRAAVTDGETLQLLWASPSLEQQRPNLLLAAVHCLILGGSTHPLRHYFPSAGGARTVDAEFVGCFAAFREAHARELRELIASRTTQTNEVGRCAVLWPALQHVARTRRRSELALLDFGCSAGLNLGVDAYRYDYGAYESGAAAGPDTPAITCRLVGPVALPAPQSPPLRIVPRLGLDVAPMPVNDAAAMRWLRACLWPHDLERQRRFDQAVALAQRHAWPVRREADCVAALEAWVRALPHGTLAVVLNSWVLTYLDRDARHRYVHALEALVQERRAVWLSGESPRLRLSPATPEAPAPSLPGSEYAAGSLWTLCTAGSSAPSYEVLARSHPHGKWLEWLANSH